MFYILKPKPIKANNEKSKEKRKNSNNKFNKRIKGNKNIIFISNNKIWKMIENCSFPFFYFLLLCVAGVFRVKFDVKFFNNQITDKYENKNWSNMNWNENIFLKITGQQEETQKNIPEVILCPADARFSHRAES